MVLAARKARKRSRDAERKRIKRAEAKAAKLRDALAAAEAEAAALRAAAPVRRRTGTRQPRPPQPRAPRDTAARATSLERNDGRDRNGRWLPADRRVALDRQRAAAAAARREPMVQVTVNFYGHAPWHREDVVHYNRGTTTASEFHKHRGDHYQRLPDHWSGEIPERLFVDGEIMDTDDPRYVALLEWLREHVTPNTSALHTLLENRYPLVRMRLDHRGPVPADTPATHPRGERTAFCKLQLNPDAPGPLAGFLRPSDAVPGMCAFRAIRHHLEHGTYDTLWSKNAVRVKLMKRLGWQRGVVPPLELCIPGSQPPRVTWNDMARLFRVLQIPACSVDVGGVVIEDMCYHPDVHGFDGKRLDTAPRNNDPKNGFNMPTLYFKAYGGGQDDGHIEAIRNFQGHDYARSYPFVPAEGRFVSKNPILMAGLAVGTTAPLPLLETGSVRVAANLPDVLRALWADRPAMDTVLAEARAAAAQAAARCAARKGQAKAQQTAADAAMRGRTHRLTLTYIPRSTVDDPQGGTPESGCFRLFEAFRAQGMLWDTNDGFKILRQTFTYGQDAAAGHTRRGIEVTVVVKAQRQERTERAMPLRDPELIRIRRDETFKFESALMPAHLLTTDARITAVLNELRPGPLNFTTHALPADGLVHHLDQRHSYTSHLRGLPKLAAGHAFDMAEYCAEGAFVPRDDEAYIIERTDPSTWPQMPEVELMPWLGGGPSYVDVSHVPELMLDVDVCMYWGLHLAEFMRLCPGAYFTVKWVFRPSVLVDNPAPAALQALWTSEGAARVEAAAPGSMKTIVNSAWGKMNKVKSSKTASFVYSSIVEAEDRRSAAREAGRASKLDTHVGALHADDQGCTCEGVCDRGDECNGDCCTCGCTCECNSDDDKEWVVHATNERPLERSFLFNSMLVLGSNRIRLVRDTLLLGSIGVASAAYKTDAIGYAATPSNDARVQQLAGMEPHLFVNPTLGLAENCGRFKIELKTVKRRPVLNPRNTFSMSKYADAEARLPRRTTQIQDVLPFDADSAETTRLAFAALDRTEHRIKVLLAPTPGSGKTSTALDWCIARGRKVVAASFKNRNVARLLAKHGPTAEALDRALLAAVTNHRLLGRTVQAGTRAVAFRLPEEVDTVLFEELGELSQSMLEGVYDYIRKLVEDRPGLLVILNGDGLQTNPVEDDVTRHAPDGYDAFRMRCLRTIAPHQIWLTVNWSLADPDDLPRMLELMVALFGRKVEEVVPVEARHPYLLQLLAACPADQGFGDVAAVAREFFQQETRHPSEYGRDTLLITMTNATAELHNLAIHRTFEVGDELAARYANHADVGIFRGSSVVITEVGAQEVVLQVPGWPDVRMPPTSVATGFRHTAASTVQYLQGQRTERHLVIGDMGYALERAHQDPYGEMARNFWTAATRSRRPFQMVKWAKSDEYRRDQREELKRRFAAALPGHMAADLARGLDTTSAEDMVDYIDFDWGWKKLGSQFWRCPFCHEGIDAFDAVADRIDADAMHTKRNCQMMHKDCNRRKAAMWEKSRRPCADCGESGCACACDSDSD